MGESSQREREVSGRVEAELSSTLAALKRAEQRPTALGLLGAFAVALIPVGLVIVLFIMSLGGFTASLGAVVLVVLAIPPVLSAWWWRQEARWLDRRLAEHNLGELERARGLLDQTRTAPSGWTYREAPPQGDLVEFLRGGAEELLVITLDTRPQPGAQRLFTAVALVVVGEGHLLLALLIERRSAREAEALPSEAWLPSCAWRGLAEALSGELGLRARRVPLGPSRLEDDVEVSDLPRPLRLDRW